MSKEEYTCFYDQNFLNENGLNDANIIQYFSLSQFYDKQCLNEVLKMQSQFANLDISDKLTTSIGFYYILEYSTDNLHIISKKEYDGEKTVILRTFYCMFGYIYISPTIKAISDARIIDTLSYLNDALDKYEELKKFNWINGFTFSNPEITDEAQLNDIKFLNEVLHEFMTSKKTN